MSTPRIALTNRTPELRGPDPAAPAAPNEASFPEVLGSAVNALATTETGNGGSAKAHQRQSNDAAKEETARPRAAPSDKAAAATDDAPGLQSRPRPNYPRDPGKHVGAGAAMVAPTVLSAAGPEPAPLSARSITRSLTCSASSKNESAAPHDAVRATMTDRTQKEATRRVDEPNGEAPRDLAPRQNDKLFVEFSAAASGHFGVADSSAPSAAAGLPEEIRQANPPSISTADPTASSNLAQQRAALSDAGTRSLDLPAGRTRPDAGAVSGAQLTSPSSAVQAPDAQPLDGITIETPQLIAASQSADAAGSAHPDISGFGRELDLDSDDRKQAIATAAWPPSAGDGRDAPLRSPPTSTEDRIRSAIPDLLPIAPIVEPGNTVPGGPTVEASAPSSASSVLPTDLSDQVLHHVIGSIDNGGGQVVLRLHPPELGDLAVRILVNGRDVSAWFASPQIQVQQAISQAIGQLRVDLGSLGYNLAGISVGAEAWSFGEPEEGSLPPQQGAVHRSRPERSSAEPSPSVSSGVSIYV